MNGKDLHEAVSATAQELMRMSRFALAHALALEAATRHLVLGPPQPTPATLAEALGKVGAEVLKWEDAARHHYAAKRMTRVLDRMEKGGKPKRRRRRRRRP